MNLLLSHLFRFHRSHSMVVVACAYLGIAFGSQASLAQKKIPPPGDERSCTASACHDEYAKKKVVHFPVSSDGCDACHEISDEKKHRFEFTDEGGALCMDCHEDDFEGEVMHSPFEQGECLSCHQPHASDAKHLLITPTVGELCLECHDEVTEDLEYLHGPVGAGACTSCHNPHASDHPMMLFAEGRKMCSKCHTDVSVKIDRGPFVHEPVREDCSDCHLPHGGANRMNLHQTAPDLCLDCHDDIADTLDEIEVAHHPVMNDRSCVSCHDPHASSFDYGLIYQSMEVCLSCHDKELGEGDQKIANIGALLKSNPNHHGPVAQKDCTACHSPHGSGNFRMLTDAFPEKFYNTFEEDTFALCFECHDVELLEDEETDEATEFRNGERNLHYLHVNREVKGRSCRACHDPHASSYPKQIANTVPFGQWAIPLQYEKTESGGSCAPGCHKLYKYDRDESVVNLPRLQTSEK